MEWPVATKPRKSLCWGSKAGVSAEGFPGLAGLNSSGFRLVCFMLRSPLQRMGNGRDFRCAPSEGLYGWGGMESETNPWKWLIAGEIALGNCCERLLVSRCF